MTDQPRAAIDVRWASMTEDERTVWTAEADAAVTRRDALAATRWEGSQPYDDRG